MNIFKIWACETLTARYISMCKAHDYVTISLDGEQSLVRAKNHSAAQETHIFT